MDKTINAAYLLVDYAWAVLNANDSKTWSRENYGSLVPIVPLAEERELSEYNGPHIVYGYAEDATGTFYAMKSGSLSLAVYDDSFRRLTRTMNILNTAFERHDESARDVNSFTTDYLEGAYLGIRFGSINVSFVDGGSPEEEEGGRQSAIINIRYSYFVDYDVITSV